MNKLNLHNNNYGEEYWYDLSVSYAKYGNYGKAISAIRQALALNPKEEYLYISLANYYLALGDTQYAKAVLAQGKRVKS